MISNRRRLPKRVSPVRSVSMRVMPTTIILAVVAIAVTMSLFVGFPKQTMAQTSQQVSFRISRLETQVRSLQSQINQLEAQLGRLDREPGNPPSVPPPVADTQPSPAESNLMFDQLATLVIETRQDMFALQEQVEAIEERLHLN